MKTIDSIVGNVSGVMYVIAGIALTLMVAITVADVILRIFKMPIVGTYEIVGLLGAIMVGFAIPQTSRAKGHVSMDFLEGKLPAGLDRLPAYNYPIIRYWAIHRHWVATLVVR